MGIIDDFLNSKKEIIDYRNSGGLFAKINYRKNKKMLKEAADKLKKANTPMSKDEILELAQSLYVYGINVSENIKNVNIEYFPKSETFRIKLYDANFVNIDNSIKYVELIVSRNNKILEVKIEIETSKDITKAFGLNCENKLYSNIKEMQVYITSINKALYLLIYSYIYDILSDMN